MNGGIVPLLLIGFTVGLMLAFARHKVVFWSLAAFAGTAVIAFLVPVGVASKIIFVGLWASMIITASTVYLPIARTPAAIIALSINAGLWLGACAALSGNLSGLALAFLTTLAAFPAKWIVARKFDIVIKVVASWMIAIASLSMFVSLMPTPGYVPDHME